MIDKADRKGWLMGCAFEREGIVAWIRRNAAAADEGRALRTTDEKRRAEILRSLADDIEHGEPPLLNCPFCDASEADGLPVAPNFANAENAGKDWAVNCLDCGARGPTWAREYTARVAWNNRRGGRIAELEALLKDADEFVALAAAKDVENANLRAALAETAANLSAVQDACRNYYGERLIGQDSARFVLAALRKRAGLDG